MFLSLFIFCVADHPGAFHFSFPVLKIKSRYPNNTLKLTELFDVEIWNP
jgi:hypothetical protein